MRKSAPISFRLPEDLKSALKKLAKVDQRSLSAYVTIALQKHVEWLTGRKHKE
jgi:predicted transcriptional regulator